VLSELYLHLVWNSVDHTMSEWSYKSLTLPELLTQSYVLMLLLVVRFADVVQVMTDHHAKCIQHVPQAL
jgi:hypothetical protein